MKMNAVLKINRILAILALIFLAGSAHASGWNDYSLDIGDGYKVFRANSLQVCIVKTAGSIVILDPMSYPEVGPVVAYDMKKDFILTKNAGRGPRNQFKGDTFDDVDYKRDWYFLIPKANNEPLGPYTKETFMRVLKEKGIEDVEWVEPQNPNFWTPLLGGADVPNVLCGDFHQGRDTISGDQVLLRVHSIDCLDVLGHYPFNKKMKAARCWRQKRKTRASVRR